MNKNKDVIGDVRGLEKISLDEIKVKLGIPNDAQFKGYLIHVLKADEFLGFLKETELSTQRGFVKTPEQALVFEKLSDAFEVTRPDKDEIVVGMFDLGKQLLIYPIN